MEGTLHITLPQSKASLLDGLELILPGWSVEEIDADLTWTTWVRLPASRRRAIEAAGQIIV